jgi:hypothetical protein
MLCAARPGDREYDGAKLIETTNGSGSSAGALANTYIHDSFGNTTASTGTLRNYFQYTGREFNTETGIYYYRERILSVSRRTPISILTRSMTRLASTTPWG